MDALRSLWCSEGPPASIPGDKIYQTHFMDNKKLYESLLLASTWCFNDVLDPDKLSNALSRLLEIDDWRKLGGRFRRGSGRMLELHVPANFTPERPAVAYSHEVLDMKLQDHSLYQKFPRPTEGLSFHASPLELRPLVIKAGVPQTMADLLKGDQPALSLHIVSFDDATMVTLVWPHNLMDAMGLSTIVKAWSLVVAGSEAEVPPLLGTHNDTFYEIAGSEAAQQEQSALVRIRIAGFGMLIFAFNYVWDLLWDSRMDDRVFCLPKETVQRLRSKCLSDLPTDGTDGDEKPWISEHDALMAVWAKCYAIAQPKPRPVIVLCPFDTRGRLPGTINREDAYVQNLVLESFTTISTELATSSLGRIALNVRQTLQRNTTAPQILALLRSFRQLWDSGNEPMGLSGPPTGKLLVTTDWGRARLFHVAEFGPAVIRQGEESKERTNPVGSPFWAHSMALQTGITTSRNAVIHLGKDHEGNTWHMGLLPHRTWDIIQETLENL